MTASVPRPTDLPVGGDLGDRRTQVLLAAVEAFAERGTKGVRLKDISDRVGMSPGHILYYFGRKDRVLLETLRWSETELAERRRAGLGRMRSPWRAVRHLVDVYLPVSSTDPRWNLWVQVNVSPPDDDAGRSQVAELEDGWLNDLVAWVARGVESGDFQPVDVGAWSARWIFTMNGLAEHVRLGIPGHDARWARRYVESGMAAELGVTSEG
jgi:AcrR family transcriptional regulator